MEYLALVTIAALLELMMFTGFTGYARAKSGLQAPATTGDPLFERYYRVQQNTIEQMVVFLPALWLCGIYVHAGIAAGIGLVFVVGRLLFFRAYVKNPPARALGFVMGLFATAALVLGGLGGVVLTLVRDAP